MKILSDDWLTKPPFDYELKKYIFLAANSRFEDNISSNNLHTTLNEIEHHLNKLYTLKYQKDELDEHRKIITGIDLDLMDLEYVYDDEDKHVDNIYKAIDYATSKLEKLHKLLRTQWRSIADKIVITEIPDKKPTKVKGIVFLSHNDTEDIKVYSYSKPSNMNSGWETLLLKKECEIKNNLRKIAEIISIYESNSDEHRFWRFSFNGIDTLDMPYDDCILPITKYSLYNRLKFN